MSATVGNTIDCPVCGKMFSNTVITEHVNSCLNSKETICNDSSTATASSGVKRKSSDWGFFTKKKQQSLSKFDSHVKPPKISRVDLGVRSKSVLDNKVKKVAETDSVVTINVDEVEQNVSTKTIQIPLKEKSTSYEKKSCETHIKILASPLADKVRPDSFEDYVGQTKAVGTNSMLHSLLLKGNSVPSMVLWGPPGCGKTTLAKIVARQCQRGGNTKFITMSATSASVKDVKETALMAQNDLKMLRRKTILFLDEIHRFNKLQQDALLPHVENGIITLIGATTENPSFHINSALLSRCRVITLDKLKMEDVKMIVRRACRKMGVRIKKSPEESSSFEENGGSVEDEEGEDGEDRWEQEFSLDSNHNDSPIQVYIEENAVDALSGLVDGDARAALNGLQMTVQARLMEQRREKDGDHDCGGGDGKVVVTLDNVKEGLQRSHVLYDRNGEEHYNIVSAMIKSMRGSNDSAALYWMARMLLGGENPLFVARRLVVFASEDVGLADSTALNLAVSTYQACQLIGMPECQINLAHCVVYLARAPKSVESFTGYHHAKQCVKNQEGPYPSVPLHLRNAPTGLMKKMGYGEGYKYPPAFEGEVIQEYFPPSLAGTDFFAFMKEQRPRDMSAAADANGGGR